MMLALNRKVKRLLINSLGQIMLIFLGVTVAFWFESWKTNQDEREFEREILTALRHDLEQTTFQWEKIKAADDLRLRYLNDLLKSTDMKLQPDSLSEKINIIGNFNTYYPLFTSYETLKSKGFDLVTDQQLRTLISFLFSDTYLGWMQSVNSRELERQTEWESFIRKWFRIRIDKPVEVKDVFMPGTSGKSYTLTRVSVEFVDFNAFVSSHEALNFLEQRRLSGYGNLFVLKVASDRTTSVITALKAKGY